MSDLAKLAHRVACQAVQEYCKHNGLCAYSGAAGAAATLEGLRRVILWKPEEQPMAEDLLKPMGDASPVVMGLFPIHTEDIRAKSGNPTHEEVRIDISTQQIVMAAMHYGADPSATEVMPNTPGVFDAFLFTAFLDAVRVVPPWTRDENTRQQVMEKHKKATSDEDIDEFRSALRATDTPPTVSVAELLGILDPIWAGYSRARQSDKNKKTRVNLEKTPLKHTRTAPLLFSAMLITPHNVNQPLFEQDLVITVGGQQAPQLSEGKTALVIFNHPAALYANFVAVAGDVLFLAMYKDGSEGFKSPSEVKEALSVLGFSCEEEGSKQAEPDAETCEASQEYAAGTARLMKHFKCKVAVPLLFSSVPSSRLDFEPRRVVAHGHGWCDATPFVCLSHGVTKSCKRKKMFS